MIMTETEAKTKICPNRIALVRVRKPSMDNPPVSRRCIGSGCMAWRWADVFNEQVDTGTHVESHSKTVGYCGLAGKP